MRQPISEIAILVAIILATGVIPPAHAMTATGVLEEGKGYVHFDLMLSVNFTEIAFDITKMEFAGKGEALMGRWQELKGRWEGRYAQWRGMWNQQMANWSEWSSYTKKEWGDEWKAEWKVEWRPEWGEKWGEWEGWMGNWSTRWKTLKLSEIEKIPPLIMPNFTGRMKEKVEYLWNRHLQAPQLASCWATPASRLGLKGALERSLNRTLQSLYGTTDVYVKNSDTAIELTTKTVSIGGTSPTTGLFDLAQSFDLYGIVTANASGLFIRSQFRHLNVTEKVDGGLFGYPGWVFTPGKTMFMDLSIFSVPLEEWNTAFDGYTTTFTLVRDINVTTPFGNAIVDPEVSLTVPGYGIGKGDVIAVKPILPTNLLPWQAMTITAVALTLILGGYWIRRRRFITAPIGRSL